MIRIDQTVGRKTKHKMLWGEDVANLMMGWGLPNEVAWMVAMEHETLQMQEIAYWEEMAEEAREDERARMDPFY